MSPVGDGLIASDSRRQDKALNGEPSICVGIFLDRRLASIFYLILLVKADVLFVTDEGLPLFGSLLMFLL